MGFSWRANIVTPQHVSAVRPRRSEALAVGSDWVGDAMWFHWNNVKIIGQRLESQKVIPLLPFQWCIMMFLIMVSFNSHWFPGFPRSWLESGCTAAIWLHLLRSSWDSLRKCRIGLYHIQYMTLYEYIKIHFRGRGWKTALGWTFSDSS